MERETDPAQEHEKDRNRFHINTVEVADAGAMRRKSSRGDGGEAVAHGIEKAHATQAE